MRDFGVGFISLVLPFGNGPGTGRIVLGPDIPATLQTFYSNQVTAAIIYYASDGGAIGLDNYFYQALVEPLPGFPQIAEGFQVLGTVYETQTIIGGTVNRNWHIGSANGTAGRVQVTVGNGVRAASAADEFWLFASSMTVTHNGPLAIVGALTIDAVSQGRGLRSQGMSQANSAAVGAEAAVITGNSADFADGRAYVVEYGCALTGSVAANLATLRLRRNNAAGTQVLGDFHHEVTNANNRWYMGKEIMINTTGGTVTYSPCLTLQASAGTITQVGNATIPRWLRVADLGAAADYPNAAAV